MTDVRHQAWDASDRGTLYICTWLYAGSSNEPGTHYQVRGLASSDRYLGVFWRCVALFFTTSVRQQPDARHVLFTNATSLPVVDGIPIGPLLSSLGVEVVRLPFTFRTPPGYYGEWQNQFYVFDIVRYLAERLAATDQAMLLDSDCVWIARADPMWNAIRRDGALTYIVMFDPDFKCNGLSRCDLSAIATDLLGCEVRHPLVYCGGELFGATGNEIRRIASEITALWPRLMERHSLGMPAFHEEGHALSFIYYKLGYPLGNGDAFIRRMHTESLRIWQNDVTPSDNGLVVWHVLSEKRLGIRRLFSSTVNRTSPLWTLETGRELRDYLGDVLGVPRNRMSKRVRDLGRRLADKLFAELMGRGRPKNNEGPPVMHSPE